MDGSLRMERVRLRQTYLLAGEAAAETLGQWLRLREILRRTQQKSCTEDEDSPWKRVVFVGQEKNRSQCDYGL